MFPRDLVRAVPLEGSGKLGPENLFEATAATNVSNTSVSVAIILNSDQIAGIGSIPWDVRTTIKIRQTWTLPGGTHIYAEGMVDGELREIAVPRHGRPQKLGVEGSW